MSKRLMAPRELGELLSEESSLEQVAQTLRQEFAISTYTSVKAIRTAKQKLQDGNGYTRALEETICYSMLRNALNQDPQLKGLVPSFDTLITLKRQNSDAEKLYDAYEQIMNHPHVGRVKHLAKTIDASLKNVLEKIASRMKPSTYGHLPFDDNGFATHENYFAETEHNMVRAMMDVTIPLYYPNDKSLAKKFLNAA